MTSTHSATPAIELRGLLKSFRPARGTRRGRSHARGSGRPTTPSTSTSTEIRAVDGLDLTIQPGEVVAFLGPNGAGKTTTLDIVLGLTEPTAGSAQVFGRRPRGAVQEGLVSAVLQSGGLLRDLTVRETIELVASTLPSPAGVDEVLARAGLTDLDSRLVATCSGGEQQRLRFALALLPEPDLLVLDEPTAGMDASARRDFWATMRADAGLGRTIVFATHYLEEADAFADRIVLVAGGRVVADGSTAEIRARAGRRQVSADLPEDTLERARVLHAVRDLPAVTETAEHGRRIVVSSSDSDTVARALIVDLDLRGLEITSPSLESAFVSLTEPHAQPADLEENAR